MKNAHNIINYFIYSITRINDIPSLLLCLFYGKSLLLIIYESVLCKEGNVFCMKIIFSNESY